VRWFCDHKIYSGDQEEMFDTDFAIMTGEIQKLLADIIDALGQ
jgi:DNA recombination-dependent growth factor C